jgi:hypothetical protein
MQRVVEGTPGQFGDALRAIDLGLPAGDFREDRQLLGFLKTAEARRQTAGFGGDRHHRRMGPVRSGDGGDEIGDPRPVLADAHPVPTGGAGVAVGHVRGVLFVGHRDEADSSQGNRSWASMYAEPTIPKTSLTPLATSVSTNASEGVMRCLLSVCCHLRLLLIKGNRL